MPRPYTQLILVNVLLASLFSITVLGAPPLPAIVGAIGAGVMLYTRTKRRERERALPPEPATGHEIAAQSERQGASTHAVIARVRVDEPGIAALSQNPRDK